MKWFFVPARRWAALSSLQKLSLKGLSSLTVLCMVPAVSSLGISFMIPYTGQMANDFHVPLSDCQNIVSLYMLAFSIAIFLTTFVADIVSKRTILLASLMAFALGSIFASLAWSFEVLTIARVIQALATGFVVVMPYSIFQETQTGPKLTESISTISVFHSIAGSLTPLMGGLMAFMISWRLGFLVTAIYALGLFWAVKRSVHTSQPTVKCMYSAKHYLRDVFELLNNKLFLGTLLLLSVSSSVYYGFLAIAPGFFKDNFTCGLILFALNASWTVGNRQSAKWSEKFGFELSLVFAVLILCIGMLPAIIFQHGGGIFFALLLLLPYALGGGIISPLVVAKATTFKPGLSGSASSLLFSVQVFVGSVAAWFFGFFNLAELDDIASFGLLSAMTFMLVLLVMLLIQNKNQIKSVPIQAREIS